MPDLACRPDSAPGPGGGRAELLVGLRCRRRRFRRLRRIRKDGLPVQDGIPKQPLIAAVHIAVHRVEVETDHVSFARGHVQDGRAGRSDSLLPMPGRSRRTVFHAIAPFHHHTAAVFGAIQAGRAIGHA